LLAIKERQHLEIEAQNATLEEQRNHIEMLDKALVNAQERLAAKERAAVGKFQFTNYTYIMFQTPPH
jgi:hypothetical protein